MPPTTDWVTLLATNDRRGGTPAARRTAPTELLWKAALPDGIRSSPVLYDGVVYVTCRDGRLYAFDSRTGK
jgi:outer membrane protein assembly factor BamB